MHPILGHARRLALYVGACLVVGLLLATALRGDAPWLAAALFFVPLTAAYAFVALSSWYVCRAFPLRVVAPWRVLVAQGVAASFAGMIFVAAAGLWAVLLDRVAGEAVGGPWPDEPFNLLWVVGVLLFALAALFHYLILAFEASRSAETRALESSLLAREAEIEALRAQIDPHFLFNSLHSVSALTTTDPAAARRMCLLLADFLRDTLRLGSRAQIPLGEELSLVERYLAIEQVRLGGRLQVAREAGADVLDCPVPPLLLQPVVENAIVHGVSQLVEGGTIHLSVRHGGGVLAIVVENPCDPDRPRTRGVGLGLALLRRRIAAHFDTGDAVQVSEAHGRFRVEIRLPARDRVPRSATARDQVDELLRSAQG